MKRSAAVILLLACSVVSAWAQGSSIHASTTLHNDGTRSTTVVDLEKRTAEERMEDSKGKLLRLTTFLMDDQNQYLGSITADPKGNVLYRTAYKRDADGRIDEETISSATGELIRRRVYNFGANNKVTGITEYDSKGNATTTTRRDNALPAGAPAQRPAFKKGKK